MAKQKTTKEKSSEELSDILRDARKRLSEFRFGISGSKVRNVREGRNLRKEIARALTELRSRA